MNCWLSTANQKALCCSQIGRTATLLIACCHPWPRSSAISATDSALTLLTHLDTQLISSAAVCLRLLLLLIQTDLDGRGCLAAVCRACRIQPVVP